METGFYLCAAPARQLILGARLHSLAGLVRLGGGCSCAGDGVHLLSLICMQEKPLPFLLPPTFAFHLSLQLPFFSAASTKSLGEVAVQPGSVAAQGKGGQSTACSPRISSGMNWGGGWGVETSLCEQSESSWCSSCVPNPASPQEAPGRGSPGTGRALPAVCSRTAVGVAFFSPPQMEETLTVGKHLV